MQSRWADANADEEDIAAQALRKREKEDKRRAKEQRKLEEAHQRYLQDFTADKQPNPSAEDGEDDRPFKKRKLTPDQEDPSFDTSTVQVLRFTVPEWGPCRHVDNFEKLNNIEEGSYGWVSRAKELATGEIVALKKLKMDNANDGFPVTGLREIQTLMQSRHPNIVDLREVVIGDGLDEYVNLPEKRL